MPLITDSNLSIISIRKKIMVRSILFGAMATEDHNARKCNDIGLGCISLVPL